MSDVDTALAIVDDFEAHGARHVAWKLSRPETLQRLRTLIAYPDKLHQRQLNACGPAVFFRVWLARDPVATANFACALLRDGSAAIGSLQVSAGYALSQVDYPAMRARVDGAHPGSTPEPADWMLLSTLRDSENIWLDYIGEPRTLMDAAAGMTLPGTLAGWLSATGLYSSVENDTSVLTPEDRQKLLNLIPTSDKDVIVFVNSGIVNTYPDPSLVSPPPASFFVVPNHYILMTAPFSPWNNPAWLNVDFWTWGRTYQGWQGTEAFFSNYFGVVIPQV